MYPKYAICTCMHTRGKPFVHIAVPLTQLFIGCWSDPVGCDPSHLKGLCAHKKKFALSNLWIAGSLH